MNQIITGYDVGALMYSPANAHTNIVDALQQERYPRPFSLAFCLEDTVREEAVEEAERMLYHTLSQFAAAAREEALCLPPVFVRVRSPQQMETLAEVFSVFGGLLTGFILPKFFTENCGAYLRTIREIGREGDYCYMPILEAPAMIDLSRRYDGLAQVRDRLEEVSDRILNIRVGGNDLCHVFGLRRHVGETIYDLRPVAALLTDIVATFAPRYVVSGPVWGRLGGGPAAGDPAGPAVRLRGQDSDPPQSDLGGQRLPEGLRCRLPGRGTDPGLGPRQPQSVSSSAGAVRMNEYNTHSRWAERTLQLARIYGVKD